MSVIIDYTYQNAEGQGIPGAAVELWTGDGGAGQSKVDDAADHGQGNYSLEYSASGKYTIKVNGTAVPHMTNKFLPADDILLQNHADGITLEFVDTGGGVYKLRVKAGGIGASHLGAITGPGMTKDGDGKLIPNVDGSTIIVDADNKMKAGDLSGLYLAVDSIVNNLVDGGEGVPLSAEQGKVLKNMLGSMDFSEDSLLGTIYKIRKQAGYINPVLDFTNAITVMAQQIMINLRAITNGTEIFNIRSIFNDSEFTKADGEYVSTSSTFVQASAGICTKIYVYSYKRPGEKYVKLYFTAKENNAGAGEVQFYVYYASGSPHWGLNPGDLTSDFAAYNGQIDISDIADNGYFYVLMRLRYAEVKRVEIAVTSA